MRKHHFNSYKEGLDLNFLRDYCHEYGTMRILERGETLEDVGRPAQWVGYVEKGCFKYIVENEVEHKEYITGFVFEGEFVADYPNCLYRRQSEVTIEADMLCEVYIIEGATLLQMYETDEKIGRQGRLIAENLFTQTYSRFLEQYRLDARGRYERLLSRCPQIVQQLSLKDIASFLNVTPKTISLVRKEITFGK